MKIVVIGGSGRIGQKLVYNLHQDSCSVFEASPSFGVNTITGPTDRLSSYAICWTHGCTMSCSDIANPASYMLLGRMLPGTIPQSARNRAPARNDVGGNVCRRS